MKDYFSEQEFGACVPACSKTDMDVEFLDKLNKAREVAGIPFVINCAYRSREWDLAKGRSGNSAHTEGKAVDIKCTTSQNRFVIISALLAVGFSRIGIAKTFIHVDSSAVLPQGVVFDYY